MIEFEICNLDFEVEIRDAILPKEPNRVFLKPRHLFDGHLIQLVADDRCQSRVTSH